MSHNFHKRLMAMAFLMPSVIYAQSLAKRPDQAVQTRSIDGGHLPPINDNFDGVIEFNASQSKPSWPKSVVPPKGAPNILLIITDDVGFGAPSTFGGVIPTLALDRVAKMGLRYTQFHSTALCSPTRAALITGRNHHSVGSGVITEMATGFPGYNSIIERNSATIGEILRQNGYSTSWFGKDHNTPTFETSQVGPFDHWPNGLGFEYFYGFMGGDTSQWQPKLFRNTTPIYPYLEKPGFNLTTAMADEAISWLKQQYTLAPDKPFFVYYAPGGTHAPHHAPKDWIEKFQGKFDMGWDELRKQIFANQKKLGVIPKDAQLTPWPKEILPEWKNLSRDEKKLFARQAEVYAAYLAYTDHEIGRVISVVEDLQKLDNTLIMYVSGDNGSSPEGGTTGTPNEIASFNGISFPVPMQLKDFYDLWGSDKTYPHMAAAWSWAFDTPFKWTKQIASHFGGTRQGMAIAWPRVIKDAGGIRRQFHHVVDVVPTILEATGIKEPVMVNGAAQKPIEGVGMKYTFDESKAHCPSHHRTQYFEMFANRAIYHDGWMACTTPINPPWEFTEKPVLDPAFAFKWELYNVTKDWTQHDNLASSQPKKLREMQDLFWIEAAKHQVMPLNASTVGRFIAPRPHSIDTKSEVTYLGAIKGIPTENAPNILNKSYVISADIDIADDETDGMLVTEGGRFGGYALYIKNSRPVFVLNLVDLERARWQSAQAVSKGRHHISFEFEYDGKGLGKGGLGILKIDDKEVARHRVDRSLPYTFQWDETFDVGLDTGTSVDDIDYQVPFKFSGTLNQLKISLR